MKRPKKNGFTLVEVIVVVGIISVLASIVLFSVSGARSNSRDKARISDLKQLELALALHLENVGSYPAEDDFDDLAPTYIPTIPSDPLGGDFEYVYSLSGTEYTLVAEFERGGGCYVNSRGADTSDLPSGYVACGN